MNNKTTFFEKTKGIDVVMYLALGWLIIISIKTLWEVFSRTGVIPVSYTHLDVYKRQAEGFSHNKSAISFIFIS